MSAHLGRHCPSHLKFLLQLCHTCRSWLVIRRLPEFARETCLGQRHPLRIIRMVLFQNGPVEKNKDNIVSSEASHARAANGAQLTSKDSFQSQIWLLLHTTAARRHLGRLVLLSCQRVQPLLVWPVSDWGNQQIIWRGKESSKARLS